MKKLILCLALALLTTCGVAMAENPTDSFWVAVDYGYNFQTWSDNDYGKVCKYNQGSGVYAEMGYKFTPEIGTRVKYGYNWGSSSQWAYPDVQVDGSLQDYYIQALYFYPVANNFDVYAGAGVGGISQAWDVKVSNTSEIWHGSAVAIPLSIGGDYKLVDHWAANIDLTYVFAVGASGQLNPIVPGAGISNVTAGYFAPTVGVKYSF